MPPLSRAALALPPARPPPPPTRLGDRRSAQETRGIPAGPPGPTRVVQETRSTRKDDRDRTFIREQLREPRVHARRRRRARAPLPHERRPCDLRWAHP